MTPRVAKIILTKRRNKKEDTTTWKVTVDFSRLEAEFYSEEEARDFMREAVQLDFPSKTPEPLD